MPAMHGKLDTRSLYSVPFGNARVFSGRTPARLVSTILHILIDRSGSTSPFIGRVAIAAYAVLGAVSGIRGVNVGMSAFPVWNQSGQPGVTTLFRHGQTTPCLQTWGSEGNTPLDEAIWHVLPALMRQHGWRRILLIFTDGEPDSISKTKAALRDAASLGVEVCGISCQCESIARLMDKGRAAGFIV